MQSVFPYLLYEDAEAAIDFLSRAFGFREVHRATGGAGGLHAELEVAADGSRIHLGGPATGSAMTYIVVDEIDAHYERAVAAGARIVEELAEQSYGARRYGAADPAGNQWYFATGA
jgi:uncharacterized glyoxalase superfamily protein PhnB